MSMIFKVGEVQLESDLKGLVEVKMNIILISSKLKIKWMCLSLSEKKNDQLWFLNQSKGVAWVFHTFFLARDFSGFSINIELEDSDDLPNESRRILVMIDSIRVLPGKELTKQPIKIITEIDKEVAA